MKSVSKEYLIEFIRENEIELKPTQPKLCLPIINRIFKKMKAGILFDDIRVEKELICDGHHRYIASVLANFSLERIPGTITSATIAGSWKSMIFEEDDWDTEARINQLNEYDAAFNNISLDRIVELLK